MFVGIEVYVYRECLITLFRGGIKWRFFVKADPFVIETKLNKIIFLYRLLSAFFKKDLGKNSHPGGVPDRNICAAKG